jgi:replicative DNA helicase
LRTAPARKEGKMSEKPDSIRAVETAMLGGLLLDPKQIPEIKEALPPADFYSKQNQIIYEILTGMEPEEVCLELVIAALSKAGTLEEAGGEVYLVELLEATPTSAHVKAHAREIREAAGARRVEKLVQEARLALKERPGDYREILDKLKDGAERLTREADLAGVEVPSMREVLLDVEEAVFCQDYKPIPTFSRGIDINLNGGLHRGRVFTIAGPAGGGKTTLAHQILDEIARRNKGKGPGDPRNVCLYVHLEQGREELLIKSYSRLARINGGNFERQEIKPEDERLNKAREIYSKEIAPYLYIVEGGERLTVREIRALVRKVAAQQTGPFQVILCVDPFQRLRIGDPDLDGDEISRVGAVATGLKILARDLQAAVILLSDTTKSGAEAMRDGKEPSGAIRGSYMAEHVTDVSAVILTYKLDNEEEIKKFTDKGKYPEKLARYCQRTPPVEAAAAVYAGLAFTKQRSGSTQAVPFLYEKAFNTFVPLEKLTDGE